MGEPAIAVTGLRKNFGPKEAVAGMAPTLACRSASFSVPAPERAVRSRDPAREKRPRRLGSRDVCRTLTRSERDLPAPVISRPDHERTRSRRLAVLHARLRQFRDARRPVEPHRQGKVKDPT